MKNILLITLLLWGFGSYSQNNEQQPGLYLLKKDSSGFELTTGGALQLASLPLKCIIKEFPNKTSHVSNAKEDHILLPHQLHPAFYGCFDWHSSVHGHWMLIKLLKHFPDLPIAEEIRSTIRQNINEANILEEIMYFNKPNTSLWERTYGWAWLLKLDEELQDWDDADGREWKHILQPLTNKIVQLWLDFLPKQTYANRTGVHPNTAFGLSLAYDYASHAQNDSFKTAIKNASLALFAKDKLAPAQWEPNGTDFLSPSLQEAELMLKILPNKDFIQWFNGFLTTNDLKHLSKIPTVSDRTDLQIVHLDGLAISKSWCMLKIADALPANDARRKVLRRAAIEHLSAALPHVITGEYGGDHWLASFAVYALVQD